MDVSESQLSCKSDNLQTLNRGSKSTHNLFHVDPSGGYDRNYFRKDSTPIQGGSDGYPPLSLAWIRHDPLNHSTDFNTNIPEMECIETENDVLRNIPTVEVEEAGDRRGDERGHVGHEGSDYHNPVMSDISFSDGNSRDGDIRVRQDMSYSTDNEHKTTSKVTRERSTDRANAMIAEPSLCSIDESSISDCSSLIKISLIMAPLATLGNYPGLTRWLRREPWQPSEARTTA